MLFFARFSVIIQTEKHIGDFLMLGYVLKKPESIPKAAWAVKTVVNDYSWSNSNSADMIEFSISSAEQRTAFYPERPPRTISGTVLSCIVGDTAVSSSSPVGVRMEISSVCAKIEGLSFVFRDFYEEDFENKNLILLPAVLDFLSEQEIAEVEKLFNKYTHSYMQNGSASEILCGAIFLDIIARVDEYARCQKNGEKKDKYVSYYASKAQSIINMRYAQRITLTSVARELGITPGYLSTVFKKTVGTGFCERLFERRITKARELVCETSLSVSEIAEASGLGDESNLRRRFKQYFGMSIREYRNTAKEQTLYHEKPTRENGKNRQKG